MRFVKFAKRLIALLQVLRDYGNLKKNKIVIKKANDHWAFLVIILLHPFQFSHVSLIRPIFINFGVLVMWFLHIGGITFWLYADDTSIT